LPWSTTSVPLLLTVGLARPAMFPPLPIWSVPPAAIVVPPL
jgi:hypothetical protein